MARAARAAHRLFRKLLKGQGSLQSGCWLYQLTASAIPTLVE